MNKEIKDGGNLTMNFLVVDDSATVRKMLSTVLKQEYPECKIVESENGKEAFSKLKSESFHLIITNLDMKEDGGTAFIHKLKGNKILAKKKILVLTSSPEKANGKFDESVKVVNKNSGQEKIKEAIKNILKK